MQDAPRACVAIVTRAFPVASQTFIVRRAERLLDRGWDVHVVCDVSDGSTPASRVSVSSGRVHVRPRPTASGVVRGLVALAVTFVQQPWATLRYLVVGARTWGVGVIRRALRDASLIRLRPDVVHYAFGVDSRGSERVGSLLRCGVVVSFMGADINYAGLGRDPAFYAASFGCFDGVHFLGDDLLRRAARRGYRAERSRVIKPGVDAHAFEPAAREADRPPPVRILSVGRLHWKKGHDYALQAVRTLVDRGIDVRYRIVGDGEHREAVAFTTNDLGLDDRVELLGALSEEDVRAQMQWADIFLHAATSEGFCYAVVEAQAMELPVVTSDADGLAENVEDAVTGFVVPRRSPAALAEKLEALALDPPLRRSMGRAGRERVLKHFDIEREIDELEDFYLQAIARHAR